MTLLELNIFAIRWPCQPFLAARHLGFRAMIYKMIFIVDITFIKTLNDTDLCFVLVRDEFIKSYVDTRQKLIEREEEVMREMVDHARQ